VVNNKVVYSKVAYYSFENYFYLKLKIMNFFKILIPILFSFVLFSSCSNYEAKKYGPVEFEIPVEGPIFSESVAEGVVTIPFNPEKFGISREEVHSMKLDEIHISVNHPDGLGVFNNVVFTVMTDNTESKEVASQKIKGNPKSLTIKGLEQAEIEGFSKTDKFYLEMTGISRKDIEDNLTIQGRLTLSVMIGK
jgi:hypothetical protein